MTEYSLAIDYVLRKEGILSENPNDPGGITKFGLSLRFLRSIADPKKYGFFGETWEDEDVINLTIEQAKNIYKGEFWDKSPFEKIEIQEVANYIFDMAINMGISPAIKCAQRACWSIYREADYINDDGILGSKTLSIINDVGEFLMLPLRSERAGYYRSIIGEDSNRKCFLNGWLNRAYGG